MPSIHPVSIPGEVCARPDLTRGAKHLYGILIQYGRRFRQVFPSQETLAKLLGCCVRSVRSYIRQLCQQNLLQTVARGVKQSLEYRLLGDEAATPDAKPSTPEPERQKLPPSKRSKIRSRSNLGSIIARAQCDDDDEKKQLAKEIVEIRRELANLGESAAIVNPGAYRHTLAKRDLDSLKQDLEHNRAQLAAVKAARERRWEPGEYVAPEASAAERAWELLPEGEREHWLAQAEERLRENGYMAEVAECLGQKANFSELVACVIETAAKELFQAADQVDLTSHQSEHPQRHPPNVHSSGELEMMDLYVQSQFVRYDYAERKHLEARLKLQPVSETNLVLGECGEVFHAYDEA